MEACHFTERRSLPPPSSAAAVTTQGAGGTRGCRGQSPGRIKEIRQQQNLDTHKAATQPGSIPMRHFLSGAVMIVAALTSVPPIQERCPGGPDRACGKPGKQLTRDVGKPERGSRSGLSEPADGSFTPPSLALKTKGALVIVGGGKTPDAVRDRFLELAGGRKARLVVIP